MSLTRLYSRSSTGHYIHYFGGDLWGALSVFCMCTYKGALFVIRNFCQNRSLNNRPVSQCRSAPVWVYSDLESFVDTNQQRNYSIKCDLLSLLTKRPRATCSRVNARMQCVREGNASLFPAFIRRANRLRVIDLRPIFSNGYSRQKNAANRYTCQPPHATFFFYNRYHCRAVKC